MTQSITHSDRFKFQDREITSKLAKFIQPGMTGYWQFTFDRLSGQEPPFYWHIGIHQGKILYSGSRTWTEKTLLSVLQRYIPQIRQDPSKSKFALLKQEIHNSTLSPSQLWTQIKSMGIADDIHLKEALRLKILSDLDTYLLLGAGEAKFINDEELAERVPIDGFGVASVMETSKQRLEQWTELKEFIPGMDVIPKMNSTAPSTSNISASQRQRIEDLVKSEKTLNQLAYGMAKDNLEVAQLFAKLVKAGLVKLLGITPELLPTIMIIDDSAIVLSQFQQWLSVLGYPVVVCQNAEIALSIVLQVKPATIFIDINMPNVSGFELVKQIRQQPEIAATPLAILTGEQKLSNKWRAQWSGCEFLTKPKSVAEMSTFQAELPHVITRLLTERNSPLQVAS